MCKVEKGPTPRVVRKRKRKPAKKKHKCAECDYWAIAPSHLAIHMVTHSGARNFACTFGVCTKKFGSNSALLRHHKIKHLGVKARKPKMNHQCGECGKWERTPYRLAQHANTHSKQKPFACDVGDCKKRFAQKSTLYTHKKSHLDVSERPHACGQCDYRGSNKQHLRNHERTHSDNLVLSCDLCDYTCNADSNLVLHRKTHSGENKPICGFGGWCGYSTHNAFNLQKHKTTHTIEGQIRRKIQEHRVNTLLKEWGYDVDVELTINAKMGKCLTDTDRYFSRIDFSITSCTSAILILECDEDSHSWYNLSCEFSRMADVQASLVKAGFTAPVYWIRYNPNGKYHIGGEQVKMNRPKREAALKKHLAKLCSPDFEPKQQMSIHYFFYDLESLEAGPSIMSDSDFPAVLKPMVSWCP